MIFFMDVQSLFIAYIYTGYIGVNNKKMWYKIYFIGKLKKKLIGNEFILLCYFNTVIQSLGSLGKGNILVC